VGTRASTAEAEQKGASSAAKLSIPPYALGMTRMVLFIRGIDGSEFEVTIEGPGPTTKVYGAGGMDYWVEVQARISTPTQNWTFSGEILDNNEVGLLADWLEAVANGKESSRELSFAEPDFSFHLMGSSEAYVALRIYFELRGRPPSAPAIDIEEDLWVDLQVFRADLLAAAAALRQDASQLPSSESLRGL